MQNERSEATGFKDLIRGGVLQGLEIKYSDPLIERGLTVIKIIKG